MIGDVLIVSDVGDQLMADHIGKVIGRLRSANWARSWVDDCLLVAVAFWRLLHRRYSVFSVLPVPAVNLFSGHETCAGYGYWYWCSE